MRRSAWLLAGAATAALIASPALGDDAQDLLTKSRQAMLDAPAMRMTMDSVNHSNGTTLHMVVEFVNPASVHSTTTVDGKATTEMVSDGHKTFTRHGTSTYQPVPGTVAAAILNSRKQAATAKASDVTLVGHEEVNGIPADVYTYKTADAGSDVASTVKIWISGKDDLPLKEERQTGGGTNPGTGGNVDASITFVYDPAIKITLPGS